VVNAVSETDLRVLDAIGYNRVTSNEKLYFSDDRNQLFRTDPLTFGAVKIGNLSAQLTDLAVAPDGTLYGVSFDNLYLVNSTNATLTLIGALGVPHINALVFDTAGHAFAASDSNSGLYSVNIATGAATLIGNNGLTSDGDLAFADNHLYLATNQNSFAELDPHTGSVISSVADGITNLFGLAFSHGAMFGFAGSGVYTIDQHSGASHLYTTYVSATVGTILGAATDGFGQTGNVVRGFSSNDMLSGTNLNDVMFGFSGQDGLSGLDGNDTVNGGPGNDSIDGGNGIDTAVFAGLRSAYTTTHIGTGLQVSGPDGVDMLTNVEKLAFDDVTVTVKPLHDINGDSFSDILFRNNSTGDTGYTDIHNNVFHSLGGSPTAYSVVGLGDYNGDGFSDILFRNNPTGDTGYTDVHNNVFHSLSGSPVAYSVVGSGDYNGDNFSDILFRNNSTGDTGYTDIHNNAFHSLGSSPVAYSAVGSGDYNGDGFSDILFRNNTTGDTGYTDLHNNVFHSLGGSPVAYSVVGSGDYNGDSFSDILFRNNATGDIGYTDVHNNVFHSLGSSPAAYSVAASGDYNGDNFSDILFRNNSTGDTGYTDVHNNVFHSLGGSPAVYLVMA
jgi:hypothetical protein